MAVPFLPPNALILLEGQWLLHNTPVWSEIRRFSSYNLFLTGPADTLRTNAITRHMRGGRSEADAATFYQHSDHLNTQNILANHIEPDEKLLFYKDIR